MSEKTSRAMKRGVALVAALLLMLHPLLMAVAAEAQATGTVETVEICGAHGVVQLDIGIDIPPDDGAPELIDCCGWCCLCCVPAVLPATTAGAAGMTFRAIASLMPPRALAHHPVRNKGHPGAPRGPPPVLS